MTPGRDRASRSFLLGDRGQERLRCFANLFYVCVWRWGTLARYGMQGFVQNQTGTSFPYGTLTVNLAGCFFLGIVGQYALNYVAIPPDWRIGITTGFLEPIPRFLSSNGRQVICSGQRVDESSHLRERKPDCRSSSHPGRNVPGRCSLIALNV